MNTVDKDVVTGLVGCPVTPVAINLYFIVHIYVLYFYGISGVSYAVLW